MNEFTKQELEDIENGLGWLCEHNPFCKVEIGKLMTKVKSMIDNYCEHHECKHEFERKTVQIDLCEKCKNFKFVFALPSGEIIENN